MFAPHVETSAGVILPDDYVTAMAAAAHAVGALDGAGLHRIGLCLGRYEGHRRGCADLCPAKGLVASPCAGLVMLSERAVARLETTQSDSLPLI